MLCLTILECQSCGGLLRLPPRLTEFLIRALARVVKHNDTFVVTAMSTERLESLQQPLVVLRGLVVEHVEAVEIEKVRRVVTDELFPKCSICIVQAVSRHYQVPPVRR